MVRLKSTPAQRLANIPTHLCCRSVTIRIGTLENSERRVNRPSSWNGGTCRLRSGQASSSPARLQTLDRGAPVSLYTVVGALGHGPRRWSAGWTRSWALAGTARRGGVPARAAPRDAEGPARPGRVWHHERHLGRGQGSKRNPRLNRSRSGGQRSGVGPARLERATSCSGGKRSIQLSYGPVRTYGLRWGNCAGKTCRSAFPEAEF